VKIISSQYNNTTVMTQLLNVINSNFIKSTIDEYSSDYRCIDFDTTSHLYTMIYLQLNNSKSLRGCITELKNNPNLDSNIYIPSVSQLSRKNANRDYRVFEDIYFELLRKLKKSMSVKDYNAKFRNIKALDATVISIGGKLAPHLLHREKRAAIKMSTVFNITEDLPELVNIVKARTHDRNCIDGFFQNIDDLYLFDRAYSDYKLYDKLTDEGYKFITRLKSNASIEEIKSIYTGIEDLYDCYIILGDEATNNKTKHLYREISMFDEDKKPITFLTNIFDISAQEVADLYRQRWKIELFFKWIKQNLKIKHWLGYNENAIKIQLYTALISFILVRMIQESVSKKYKKIEIIRIIRVNLTNKKKLNEIFITRT
jgi:hypothetical protein